MSRYQRGHIYEAFGAFHVRFYHTEYVTDSSRACRACRSEVTRLCAEDRRHYSAKSKPVQLLCDDDMRKVNTATVTDRT